jgi:SagB-type dehydrogenase family enzyme
LEERGLAQLGYRRTSPSGGALHPVEVALFVNNVQGIGPGIYFYDSLNHSLIRTHDAPPDDTIQKALDGQFFAKGCAVGMVLIGHFNKVWTKYPHSRSYKDIYLDAGHVSQTCLLSATALNLQTWVTAWFRDRELSSLLDISGMETAPLFFIGLGHGSGQAVPTAFLGGGELYLTSSPT